MPNGTIKAPLTAHELRLRAVLGEFARREKQARILAARDTLLAFTTYTKPDYIVNWHHAAMCRAIDWWLDGAIKNLILSIPPRHGKSELTSRRTPAKILGKKPNAKIIATSYGADLAGLMNRDVQRIIDSAEYRDVYPETTLWSKNVRTTAYGTWLRNSEIFEVVNYTGYYRSSGVGGGITGMGADYGIIDDPIKNREEAESEVHREKVWNWYVSTFYTRLQKGGQQLLTMTRWNDDDLAGRLLKLQPELWTEIRFPALLDEEEANALDEREMGEALWPDHKSVADLKEIELTVGSYEWNSVWQQRPHAREGGMFPPGKVKFITKAEADSLTYTGQARWWDKAGSDAHMKGARTAGVHMGRAKDGRIVVRHAVSFSLAAREREERITAVIKMDNNRWVNWMEQEPGSGGKESAESTVANNPGYRMAYETSSGDKILRADPFASQWQAGNVYLVIADWNSEYIDEMGIFPNGRRKDYPDASSGAFGKVRIIPQSLDPKDYPKARR